MSKRYTFLAALWLYPGETANWHFVTLPKAVAADIKASVGTKTRGFGSVPLTVTVGKTTWNTSIFPDKISKSYFLPVKAAVRKFEDLEVGETARYTLKLL